MAYFPPTGSVVAFQDDPGKLQASVTGIVGIRGNPSVSGTLNTIQSGTRVTSLVSTVPSSVMVGASIFGRVPAFIEGGVSSVALAGANSVSVVGTVGASVIGLTPVSVSNFPVSQNVSGSVVAFQGTVPWLIGSVYGNVSGSVGAQLIGANTVSVVGQVGASIIGTVPFTQSGTIITSIVGAMAGTSSVYAVLSSITTVSVLNANANRKGATVYNNAGTIVYLKLGTAATTSVFTVEMSNDDYYELPFGWTGVVAGISPSNAGVITVTELT